MTQAVAGSVAILVEILAAAETLGAAATSVAVVTQAGTRTSRPGGRASRLEAPLNWN
jgi:hypothetical protein